MILYLIKSTLLLGVLLALYKMLLENEKMHRFNRLYLIMALVLGFTAPLISIEITSNSHIAGLEMETLNKVVNEPTQRVSETIQKAITASTPIQPSAVKSMEETSSSRGFPILPILWGIYGVVLGLLLIRFIAGLIQIRINIKKSEQDQFSEATLVLMDTPITPQSFLHYIFLNKQEYESGKVGSEILEHEYTHVRQLHSVDVMFIELLKLLFWFNPLLYFYKHAIQLNHEFLADEYVVNNVTDISNYQKKLIEVCEAGTLVPVASHFNYSFTKKRINMLSKSIRSFRMHLKQFFVLPILIVIITGTTLKLNAQSLEEASVEELVNTLTSRIANMNSGIEEIELAIQKLELAIDEYNGAYEAYPNNEFDSQILEKKIVLERLKALNTQVIKTYFESAKATPPAPLEQLQDSYIRIKTLNNEIGKIYNEIRILEGKPVPAPNPPMPPSPEKLLENRD